MGNGFNHQNSILYLCVDRVTCGHIAGRVVSQRLTRPMAFSDLGSLLLQLDRLMNRQGFPQAFQNIRSFVDDGSSGPELPAADTPEQGMPADQVHAARGALDTLVLHIVTRRNSTWQGLAYHAGREEAVSRFSSALELLIYLEREFLR